MWQKVGRVSGPEGRGEQPPPPPGWTAGEPEGDPHTRGSAESRRLEGTGLHKKDVLFIIGDWNAKVGSQETPGVTEKFGLGIQNEAGQRLIEFCQENALVVAYPLPTTQDSTHGHH